MYWRRGWEIFWSRGFLRSAAAVSRLAATHLVAQKFIGERSRLRWWMHQLLFWGCLLAGAITFPLVFGWVHFGSAPQDQMTYVTYVFGFPVASFPLKTFVAWMTFHGLDLAAVLVLAGIALALWRRMRDQGALAVQTFAMDFAPLVMLFAISVTGLALTASTLWFRGALYPFLSLLHAITVIAALLYLPFGKLFHVFQRPAQLGVRLYHEAAEQAEAARCPRCGEAFASAQHLRDLAGVLPQLGFDYRIGDGHGRWQDLCPACKRRTLATAQLRLKEEDR
jgi:hypothetical protein